MRNNFNKTPIRILKLKHLLLLVAATILVSAVSVGILHQQANHSYAKYHLLLLVAAKISVSVVILHQQANHSYAKNYEDLPEKCSIQNRAKKVESKWIIVTSIVGPTEDIRVMSQMPGWTIVVVGDRKTPANWSLPGVIYLSLEDQKHLKYRIMPYLPVDCYCRKMVGYLYAIEHGATIIHESDDDNTPKGNIEAFNLGRPFEALEVIDQGIYNHFPHFGQATTWPRGYPITRLYKTQSRRYIRKEVLSPFIRNGAVDCDPDVDGIFRLTRKFSSGDLNISFDKNKKNFRIIENLCKKFTKLEAFLKYDILYIRFQQQQLLLLKDDIFSQNGRAVPSRGRG
ncbi:putative glycosyltransferase STELLO1 [Nymphon striatum]|nr:putative glycosyltransferase STELLO1 [Nymphon striatum]